MIVESKRFKILTKGNADILDITPEVQSNLDATKITNGIINISVIGSTGALTTCEFEPGLKADLKDFFDKIIPQGNYKHDQAWGDGNGHSHLRASLVGSSLTIPFENKKLILGTWQQIIFLDFDNRKRNREIVLQFLGE